MLDELKKAILIVLKSRAGKWISRDYLEHDFRSHGGEVPSDDLWYMAVSELYRDGKVKREGPLWDFSLKVN